MLHRFEHWLLSRKPSPETEGLPETINGHPGRDSDAVATTPMSNNEELHTDDEMHINDEIGHEGHMLAEIYKMNPDDARALTRMGVFAGIALAFHVGYGAHVPLLPRCVLPSE